MFSLIFLVVVLIILSIMGAGVYYGLTAMTAAALCLLGLRNRNNWQNITPLACSICLFIFILIVTIIPFPGCTDSIMGQRRALQNQEARTAVEKSCALEVSKSFTPHFSVSRNRSGTIRIILVLIAGAAAGSAASRLSALNKLLYLRSIAVLGAIMAIAGYITQWVLPQGKRIWWMFDTPHGSPVACFINRNHYAGFLAIIYPIALILLSDALRARKILPILFHSAVFSAITFGILTSLSRGAWIATFISMTITVIMILVRYKSRNIVIGSSVIITTVSLVIFAVLIHSEVKHRFKTFTEITSTTSARMRFNTWIDAVRIMPDYVILGTGANGFRMIFPQYRTVPSRKEFKHTENEYIQLPVETGLVGTVAILAILACYFARWRHHIMKGNTCQSLVNIGILGAIIAAAVHASLDFPIRVPLYFITLCSMMGLVISPLTSVTTTTKKAGYSPWHISGLVICMALSPVYTRGIYRMDSPDFVVKASPDELCRALSWAPTSWQIWYHMGNMSMRSGKADSYEFGEECITRATEYDPLNYRLWEILARIRIHQNNTNGAASAYKRLKELRPWKRIEELDQLDEQ